MTKAIISYIDDNVAERFEKDFLPTLREVAKFDGEVHLLYFGKDIQFEKRVSSKYCVKIHRCYSQNRVSNQRNREIANLLTKMNEITNVICIDGGDVWFQKPIDEIFEKTEKGYGVVEEDIRADSDFNLYCMSLVGNSDIREKMLKVTKRKRLINSGMIAGERESVLGVVIQIAKISERLNQDYFALDQAVFNYVIRKRQDFINLDQSFNYTLLDKKKRFYVKKRIFYDKKLGPVSVVHNIGNTNRMYLKGMEDLEFPKKMPKGLKGEMWGITCYFNPLRYKTRYNNYKKFREESKRQGLKLLTVEMSVDGNYELNDGDAEILVRVKSKSAIWQKERLLNVGIEKLPEACDKIVWIDADIVFENEDWVAETSNKLEDYCVVQPFSCVKRLKRGSGKRRIDRVNSSIGNAISRYGYKTNMNDNYESGDPGFCWAARREILSDIGLFDKNILCSNDVIMFNSFIGNNKFTIYNMMSEKVQRAIDSWREVVYPRVMGSVSYTPGVIYHLWHGSDKNRKYHFIEESIKKYDFDFDEHVYINEDKIWEWKDDKYMLKRLSEEYFWQRNEDGNPLREVFLLYEWINIKKLFLDVDRIIGKIGIFLRRNYPELFLRVDNSRMASTWRKKFKDQLSF